MSAFLITWLALCAVLMVRNSLAWGIQRQRIEEIHQANVRDINAKLPVDCAQRYKQLHNQYLMVLDLTKWTYRQFYPQEVA